MTTTTNSPIIVTKRSKQARRKVPKDILKQPTKGGILGLATLKGTTWYGDSAGGTKVGHFLGMLSPLMIRGAFGARLAEFEKWMLAS